MFALEMMLLTGRYVATAYNDRSAPEWPPHPARLFSALVAAHHAEAAPSDAEREALEWLEQQEAPSITASEASVREVVTVFVPVNDTTVVGSFDTQIEQVDKAQTELDAARRELRGAGEGDAKARRRLEKQVQGAEKALEKTQKNLGAQFAKAVALQGKPGKAELENAEALFPEHRGRQPRTFPSVTPEHPTVVFQWPEASPSPEVRAALGGLCQRVVRVGHSSSLVRLRTTDELPAATWEPDEYGGSRLRVPLPGQLSRLQAEFERHQETQPRVLPSFPQGYSRRRKRTEASIAHSVFDEDWLILRFVGGQGRALPILATAAVAQAVRGALLKHSASPVPELLSGHTPEGRPSQQPHLAFVSLPAVAGPHSDGHLLGVAVVFPQEASREQRAAVFRALDAWESASRPPGSDEDCPELRLVLGEAGEWRLQRVDEPSRLMTLQSRTWCRSSGGQCMWLSATPVALDRNPGDLGSRDPAKAAQAFAEAEQVIGDACERVGLPRPERVWVTRSAPLTGSQKVQRFPRFPSDP
ncbi:MAG: type I-U CRISPR-associated protein Cas5/Cas6, partial [Polyangiaceae bacterium]|nr:type I-U CRISPR-associated protein Cas5/Cas6 [Polyangiaceae bacterium]